MSATHDERIEIEAVEWFARLRDVPVAPETRSEFARWRLADPAHARAYAEVVELWDGLDGLERPSIQGSSDAAVRRRVVSKRIASLTALAAAASIAVYVALPDGGIAAALAGERTNHGVIRSVTLPDGSSATMDAATAMSVDMRGPDRVVTLVTGRAYFNVRHMDNRLFRVRTGDTEIVDVGTAFEVERAGNAVSVSVEQGVVDVARNGAVPRRVAAGYRLTSGAGGVVPVVTGDVAAWRSRRIVFHDRALGSIVAELARYQSGWVMLLDRSKGHRRLTGSLDIRDPGAAIGSLAQMAGLRVTRIGPVIVLQGR